MAVELGIPGVGATQIPAREHVKFYQVGSYAVGNRLAGEDYRSVPVSYTHLTLPTTPYV